MTFTVTLLGTDTEYTPNPQDSYPRGETLSFISSLIKGSEEKEDNTGVEHLRGPQQLLIDGPKTRGQEVGDRIGRAVAAILEAVSRGETQINIIAHSRGAVEALLVAHELQRIQTDFKENPLSNNIDAAALAKKLAFIKDKTPCGMTRASLQGTSEYSGRVVADALERLDLNKISNYIQYLNLSIFNIDPVPGGRYQGAPGIAWVDERFYKVPKIVRHYQQILYANERTRCFKPIVPACVSPETQFELMAIPGHHGTGSGNPNDQQGCPDPERRRTTDAQGLLVVKLFEFLHNNEVEFKQPEEIEGDQNLKELVLPLIEKTAAPKELQLQLRKAYLEIYGEIVKNRQAYQRFDSTSYAFLNQEEAWWAHLGLRVNDRIVHYQAHNDTYLKSFLPTIASEQWFNNEHARLGLHKILGLDENESLPVLISKTTDKLLEIIRTDIPVEGSFFFLDLQSLDTNFLANQGRGLLESCLNAMIAQASQAYLYGQFQHSSEKAALFNVVKEAYEKFAEISQNQHVNNNQLATFIISSLREGLKNTLEAKHQLLIEQSATVFSGNKAPAGYFEELMKKIESFKKDLPVEISSILASMSTEYDELPQNNKTGKIRELVQKSYKALHDQERFKKLKEYKDNHPEVGLLEDSDKACLAASVFLEEADTNLFNLAERERQSKTLEARTIKLKEALSAYRELDDFLTRLDQFSEFNTGLDQPKMRNELEYSQFSLVHQTAKYIVEQNLTLEEVQKIFAEDNQDFYQLVSPFALALGAKDPQSEALKMQVEAQQKQLKEQEQQLAKQKEELNEKIEEINKKDRKLAERKEELDLKDKAFADKDVELAQKSAKLAEMEEASNQHIQTIIAVSQAMQEIESSVPIVSERPKQASFSMQESQNKLTQAITAEEARCVLLIQEKLLPKTKIYLKYLFEEIQAKTGLSDGELENEALDLGDFLNGAEAEKALKAKFLAVAELYNVLTDPDQNTLASTRIIMFLAILAENNTKIGKHRDPLWMRFVTSMVTAVVSVFAQLIPLLSTPSWFPDLKFWQSRGQRFFAKVNSMDPEVKRYLDQLRTNPSRQNEAQTSSEKNDLQRPEDLTF